MKIKTLLATLLIALTAATIPASAQDVKAFIREEITAQRVKLDPSIYLFGPNGRVNREGDRNVAPTYDDGTWWSVRNKVFDGNSETYWDSKEDALKQIGTGDDFFTIRFWNNNGIGANDILEFEITFADENHPETFAFWSNSLNIGYDPINLTPVDGKANTYIFKFLVPGNFGNSTQELNFYAHGSNYKNEYGNSAMKIAEFAIYKYPMQVSFNWRWNNNGDNWNNEPTFRALDYYNATCNIFDGNNSTYWDSKEQVPRKKYDNGNDLFHLRLYKAIKGDDLLEFEVEFSDAAHTPAALLVSHDDKTFRVLLHHRPDEANPNKYSFYFHVPATYTNKEIQIDAQDSKYNYQGETEKGPGGTCSSMQLSGLKIYRITNDIPDHTYTLEQWANLYNQDYAGFQLKHTRGWVDWQDFNPKNDQDDRGVNILDGSFITDNDWGNNRLWDSNGDYTQNDIDRDKIDIVSFSYVGTREGEQLNGQNYDPVAEATFTDDRQRTYTIVHEVTVFPGERVNLDPFSDIHESTLYDDTRTSTEYQEDFIRWYDYQTDEKSVYLQFFQDPRFVATTDFGHIGGSALFGNLRSPITVPSFVCPQEGLGEKEVYIAADFSRGFSYLRNGDMANRINKDDKFMIEPTVMYRHIFHIRTARKAADEFNGDGGKNNAKYVAKHRRIMSARADELFTIRLDHSMPDPDDKAAQDAGSDIVFTGSAGAFSYADDGKQYGRVRKYGIHTYPYDGGAITGAEIEGMFSFYSRSVYTTMTSMVSKDQISYFAGKGDVFWEGDKQKLYRAIRCPKDMAKAGKYLVRIVGLTADGSPISADGSAGDGSDPLIIQEYVVEFVDYTKASFMTEADYNKVRENPDDKQYHHTEDYLERFSDNKQEVNFDEYDGLPDYFIGKDYDKKEVPRIVKLPMAFDRSNYSTPYNAGGDYNVYKIIDHSGQAPFKRAADAIEGGVYDRLYYNTNKEQRGFMYYVNAAADPGEMAKISLNDLCNGTTIYVSAWVNEFTEHEPETANVIFNFRATVNEYDSEGKFVRTVDHATLHGFSSGYVKRTNKEDDFETDGDRDDYSDDNRGEQGQWMHVYYSFVPDISPISEYLTDDRYKIEYELVLENNCVSSQGADYAVDDIRMFIVPPRVSASQVRPVCDLAEATDTDRKPATIKIDMPFESLLSAAGLNENDAVTKEWVMQYAVLDKVKYDKAIAETNNAVKAFTESVLRYPHRHIIVDDNYNTNKDKNLPWGTIKFYTNYGKNVDFDPALLDNPDGENANPGYAKKEESYGERNIVFLSTPMLGSVADGQEYYIVVANFESDIFKQGTNNATYYTDETKAACDETLAKLFDLEGDCARKAVFRIKGPAQIIVDGYYQADGEEITCCENQRPVVQVNIFDRDGEVPDSPIARSPYLDWYADTYSEFSQAKMTDGTTLFEVLAALRKAHPDAITWDMPEKGEYTEGMRSYLKGLCDKGTLLLHQSSYVFPATKKNLDGSATYIYVTAIPLNHEGEGISDKLYLCTSPTEVRIRVDNTSPRMLNGFNAGVEYPDDMDDVALRAGLTQLNGVSYASGDDLDGTLITEGTSVLWMPLRGIKAATNGVANLQRRANDPYVYLASTDDPLYRNLGVMTLEEDDDLTANQGYQNLVTEPTLNATSCYENTGVNTGDERIQGDHIGNTQTGDVFKYHVFFPFEGTYKVTMRYAKGNDGTAKISLSTDDNAVYGETEVTKTATDQWNDWSNTKTFNVSVSKAGNYDLNLTIVNAALNINTFAFNYVPYATHEYLPDFGMMVVGELTDVKAPVGDNEVPMARIKFYNDRFSFREGRLYKFKFSFEEDYTGAIAPAAGDEPCNGETVFTVKVVPEYQKWTGAEGVNWNNDANWSRVEHDDLLDGGKSVADEHVVSEFSDGNKFTGSFAPMDFTKVIIPAGAVYPQLDERKHDRTGNAGVTVNNGKGEQTYAWAADAPAAKATEGLGSDATKDIQYDMASVLYGDAADVYCRLWYANAAEQIHFNSNAEMLNQQHLDYQKAWVDMEMAPARWYTASSPLQATVAGDMYLPTDGARQMTQLFTDINFNTDLNDRFRPAVYQRGWDKGTANVYELPTTYGPVSNVATALDWSEVYNDVQEKYSAGIGYSVKTDISEISGTKPALVKFRFPKADTNYDYWNYEGNQSGTENGGEIVRDNAGRLHELTDGALKVTLTNVSGEYFLAGNPFMAHLDMDEFFKANTDLDKTYWIMTAGANEVSTLDPQAGWVATGADNNGNIGTVPPMQGFFVKKSTNDNATELDITFTPEMMKVIAYDTENGGLLMRSGDTAPAGLTITAGDNESRALLRRRDGASAGYLAGEDAEALIERYADAPQVYTVGGNRALSINTVATAEGTEIGLLTADDDATTVLTFEGTEGFEELSLLDAATGDLTPLTDGMTYAVKGRAAGRLFLVKEGLTAEAAGIEIRHEGREVTVVTGADNGNLTVRVVDALGRVTREVKGAGRAVTLTVDPGVSVIEARDGLTRTTRKILAR